MMSTGASINQVNEVASQLNLEDNTAKMHSEITKNVNAMDAPIGIVEACSCNIDDKK